MVQTGTLEGLEAVVRWAQRSELDAILVMLRKSDYLSHFAEKLTPGHFSNQTLRAIFMYITNMPGHEAIFGDKILQTVPSQQLDLLTSYMLDPKRILQYCRENKLPVEEAKLYAFLSHIEPRSAARLVPTLTLAKLNFAKAARESDDLESVLGTNQPEGSSSQLEFAATIRFGYLLGDSAEILNSINKAVFVDLPKAKVILKSHFNGAIKRCDLDYADFLNTYYGPLFMKDSTNMLQLAATAQFGYGRGDGKDILAPINKVLSEDRLETRLALRKEYEVHWLTDPDYVEYLRDFFGPMFMDQREMQRWSDFESGKTSKPINIDPGLAKEAVKMYRGR